MPHRKPFPGKRFALALMLAHFAAAYAWGLSLMAVADVARMLSNGVIADGLPSPRAVCGALISLPVAAFGIALISGVFLIPYSILGGLISLPIVATRRVGAIGASVTGGVAGMLMGVPIVWDDAARRGMTASCIGGSALAFGVSFCAGAAFGWTMWRVAIRPWRRSATPLSVEPSTT